MKNNHILNFDDYVQEACGPCIIDVSSDSKICRKCGKLPCVCDRWKPEKFDSFIRKRKKKEKIYPPVNHSVGPLNMADALVTNQVTCI